MKRIWAWLRALIHRLARGIATATRQKAQPFSPCANDLDGGIRHVVYEYSNLVRAHRFIEENPSGGHIVILVFNAFLLNCRQLQDFFGRPTAKPDILALHYSGQTPIHLPVCTRWRDAIDKQLAHLSYGRVRNPRSDLSERPTRMALFIEVQTAFQAFLPTVREQKHKDEFNACLAARSKELGVTLP